MTGPDGGAELAAARFPALPPERAERWAGFLRWEDQTYFPVLVGLQMEELRLGYARMRLPYRPELLQPAGVVHGGALATLIDTVVVPAVGSGYDEPMRLLTVTMTVSYLGAVMAGQDAVAEGWVVKRGRSTVFCRAEVRTAADLVAAGDLVYAVRPAPPGSAATG